MSEGGARLDELKGRIEAIEEAYEFFLAYAAQGVGRDAVASTGERLRSFLSQADEALDALPALVGGVIGDRADGRPGSEELQAFQEVVESDARKAGAALRLVAAQPSVSSQLVDNLNASIHLRALLTDLFLLDEVLGEGAAPSPPSS